MHIAFPSVFRGMSSRLLPNFQTVYKQCIIAGNIHRNQHVTASDKNYGLPRKENLPPTDGIIHIDKVKFPLAYAVLPLSSISACDCQNS